MCGWAGRRQAIAGHSRQAVVGKQHCTHVGDTPTYRGLPACRPACPPKPCLAVPPPPPPHTHHPAPLPGCLTVSLHHLQGNTLQPFRLPHAPPVHLGGGGGEAGRVSPSPCPNPAPPTTQAQPSAPHKLRPAPPTGSAQRSPQAPGQPPPPACGSSQTARVRPPTPPAPRSSPRRCRHCWTGPRPTLVGGGQGGGSQGPGEVVSGWPRSSRSWTLTPTPWLLCVVLIRVTHPGCRV